MKENSLLIICILLGNSLLAEITLPSLFSDHMVLQQDAYVSIWGRASPGEKIVLKPGWEELEWSTFADTRGAWLIPILTPGAGGPYEIHIQGDNEVIIRDILIGEVWLASGQSNMEWPLRKAASAEQEIPQADFPEIRFFHIPHQMASTPRFDCVGEWKVCRPETAAEFSAVAYFFGKKLHHQLNRPIGLIQSTWGGSPIQSWMSRETLSKIPEFNHLLEEFDEIARKFRADPENPNPLLFRNPTILYNAMIAPLISLEIRGVIWYQGEANTRDPFLYRVLFPEMIKSWRKAWQRNLPFYFVQLAPYEHYASPYSGAGLREAQRRTLTLPKTGMVVTTDIGNPNDIHPRDKKTVGHRLANWALHQDYDQKEIVFSGPLYKRMEIRQDTIILFFAHAAGALESINGPLSHFEISDETGPFVSAMTQIDGDRILLYAPGLDHPRHARFAYENAPSPNFVNAAALPASPFRTDDFPVFFSEPRLRLSYHHEQEAYAISWDYPRSQGHSLRYRLDGKEPTETDPVLDTDLRIQARDQLTVKAFDGSVGAEGLIGVKEIYPHIGLGAEHRAKSRPLAPYRNGTKWGINDGLLGSKDHRAGYWQGFRKDTLILELDLGKKNSIKKMELRVLENHRRSFMLPAQVRFLVSNNGNTFREVGLLYPDAPVQGTPIQIVQLQHRFKNLKARYVRLEAIPTHHFPDWHEAREGPPWLMVDEWIIE